MKYGSKGKYCLIFALFNFYHVISVQSRSMPNLEPETKMDFNTSISMDKLIESAYMVNETVFVFNGTAYSFNRTEFLFNETDGSNNKTEIQRRQQKQNAAAPAAALSPAAAATQSIATGTAGVIPAAIKSILDIPLARETVVAILKAISAPFDFVTGAFGNAANNQRVFLPPPTTTRAPQLFLLEIRV